MARVDATAFKAAMALAAAQFTAALQDDTLTELAVDYKHNHSPGRNIDKLLLLDANTGVYTSNDAYIDSFFAGNYPNVGTQVGGDGAVTPATLSTATIEDAAPANIVLTFDRVITNASGVSIAGAGSAGKTILGVSIDGAVVTITVSADYINGDVVTVSGQFQPVGLNATVLTDQAVTNNVAA